MKIKPKKLATSNTSVTDLLQFESIDITELQSCNSQVIKDYNKPDNTEWEKRVYQHVIKKIEERMLEFSSTYYELNFKLPEGSKDIISYIPKLEIHNKPKVDIGIEIWNELEIKIATKDVVFHNTQSQRSEERFLKKLNWCKNLKIDALRILGCYDVLKDVHFASHLDNKNIPERQSVKNAITDLRKDLSLLFPDLPDNPIEYNRTKNGYETPIKITLLDADEYVLNMNEKLQRKALKDTGMTYEPEFDDDRKESAHYDHYEVFDEE